MKIEDISELFSGMTGVSNKWADFGNCRFVDYMNVYKHTKTDVTNLPYATVKKFNQQTLKKGDILFTSASETSDECAIASVIEDEIHDGIFLDDHLFGIRIKKDRTNDIRAGYLNHYFHSAEFRSSVNKTVRGVTRFYISKVDFVKLAVPLPPLPEQNRIASILDRFDALCNDLTDGLPAEIAARKKQYAYYRDKLLTFQAGK